MKKQMKTIMSMIIAIIMLLTAIPLSYAADETNFSVTLAATPTTVKAGETFSVTVEVGEFTNIGNGINSFMADLEYDKTKLSINLEAEGTNNPQNDIEGQNSWSEPMCGVSKIITDKSTLITTNEVIMKLTFTVLENAEAGTTTITFKNAEAANPDADFIGIEDSVEVVITEAGQDPNPGEGEDPNPGEGEDPNPGEGEDPNPGEGEDPNPGDGEDPNPGDGEDPNPGDGEDPNPGDGEDPNPGEGENPNPGEGEEKEPEKDPTTSVDKIPQAGLNPIILATIVIAAIIAIMLYTKNQKYKDI